MYKAFGKKTRWQKYIVVLFISSEFKFEIHVNNMMDKNENHITNQLNGTLGIDT